MCGGCWELCFPFDLNKGASRRGHALSVEGEGREEGAGSCPEPGVLGRQLKLKHLAGRESAISSAPL